MHILVNFTTEVSYNFCINISGNMYEIDKNVFSCWPMHSEILPWAKANSVCTVILTSVFIRCCRKMY